MSEETFIFLLLQWLLLRLDEFTCKRSGHIE